MKRFFASLVGWEIIVCLLGAGVSLFPTIIRTNSFWGERGSWSGNSGVAVHTVDFGSPAALAGIQEGDTILAVNDTAIGAGEELQDILDHLQPGTEVKLKVTRGQQETVLRGVAVEPQLGAIGYWRWQIVAGLSFLALGALVMATQPLQSARLWRPSILVVVGLGLAAVILTLPLGWTLVWQMERPDWRLRSQHPLLEAASIAAAIALVFLAACEIRGALWRNAAKTVPSSTESTA